MAKNCGEALPATLDKLADIAGRFRRTQFVFVTNDNADDTGNILETWCAGADGRMLLAFEGIDATFPDRIERMAFVRNCYIAELRRQLLAGGHFDWLVVADMDGPNETLVTGEEFENALSSAPADWDCLFANQRTAYYDIYALRHRTWCPHDCWTEFEKAMSVGFFGDGSEAARRRSIGERQVHISPQETAIPVESAFGGFAIYKMHVTVGAWYSTRDHAGHNACEHISFNEACRANGAKLYVLPSLLNSAPPQHLQPGAGSVGKPWLRPALESRPPARERIDGYARRLGRKLGIHRVAGSHGSKAQGSSGACLLAFQKNRGRGID